jgi:hypothetical protein
MRLLASILILYVTVFTAYCQQHYVQEGSVQCGAIGVQFDFSKDDSSDLYRKTKFDIKLYTGSENTPLKDEDFKSGIENVKMKYADYKMEYTTAYGPNKVPLLYNIEQPFLAVPSSDVGINQNFTFTVYCTIPATVKLNTSSNTSDNGDGGHDGDVINPKAHVSAVLNGLRKDGGSVYGDRLKYTLSIKDVYSSLLPISCKYYNPQNEQQTIPFVSDGCPRPFPDDADGFFGKMKRIKDDEYELNFRAFTIDSGENSLLGLSCDVVLCLEQNPIPCSRACWGPVPPPPAPSTASTATASTATASTATASTPPVKIIEVPDPDGDSNAASHHIDSINGLRSKADPDAVNMKTILKVTMKSASDPNSTPLCKDNELLTALYAVVGALAVLVFVLVLTLIYLLYAARRRKASQDTYLTADHYQRH